MILSSGPPALTLSLDLLSQSATTEEFVATITRVVPESTGRLSVSGAEIPSNIPPKPCFISELFPDWRPTTLDEGVRKTVVFYRSEEEV